jgi:hypothetical protein
MIATMHFPYAALLERLQQPAAEASLGMQGSLRSLLLTADDPVAWTQAGASLMPLLQARRATMQAAFDTTLAADELRRYQKYAKPGQPSTHIVQLRQKQAAARQSSSIARQSLIKAAQAFVRDAAIDVPERITLDAFIIDWIDANLPKDGA